MNYIVLVDMVKLVQTWLLIKYRIILLKYTIVVEKLIILFTAFCQSIFYLLKSDYKLKLKISVYKIKQFIV